MCLDSVSLAHLGGRSGPGLLVNDNMESRLRSFRDGYSLEQRKTHLKQVYKYNQLAICYLAPIDIQASVVGTYPRRLVHKVLL